MFPKILLMAVLMLPLLSHSQILKVDLKKDLSSKNVVDLYSASGKKKPAQMSSLARLKDHEINLKWSDCAKLAPSVFKSSKDLKGWVALSWMHCLDEKQKKQKDSAGIATALENIEQHKSLLSGGPWSAELSSFWLAAKISSLENQVQKKNPKAEASIDSLLAGSWNLSREQRSKLHQLLADLALEKKDYVEAQFFFESAQDQKDSKYIQDKLEFIAKTRGQQVSKDSAKPSYEGTGDELKIEERVKQYQKQNDAIAALKDTLIILNEYPGSRSAKRLSDKPLEIYLSLSERLAKIKALNEMEEADSTRLMEWAANLHRRADYSGALSLASRVIDKSATSPQTTMALWIAGRSAHFLGQYDKALGFYNKLIAQHANSEEAAEALFRASLIHYRKSDFSSAAALLERLIPQGRDRYELNARYWLVRSLEGAGSERAQTLRTELIERYPFSYYGLILRAESQNGKLSWPEASEKKPDMKTVFYLAGSQKDSWKRFKALSDAGWIREAQDELSNLPFLKDATLKMSLAEKLAERHQYVTAIRLLNDALENDVNLRRAEFVKIGYPEAFANLFKAEADRYSLDAALLKSLTRQESAFNFRAVSTSNALGLMQMIPPTAVEVAGKLGTKVELPDDMFRPEVNIPMGSFYISQMLGQFQGSVPFALAAYNAGPTRLKIWIESRNEVSELLGAQGGSVRDELWFDELPWTETSFYVKAILRNVLLYRLSEQGSHEIKRPIWSDLLNKKAK